MSSCEDDGLGQDRGQLLLVDLVCHDGSDASVVSWEAEVAGAFRDEVGQGFSQFSPVHDDPLLVWEFQFNLGGLLHVRVSSEKGFL